MCQRSPQLGVQYSKVRSLNLDIACWDATQIDFMRNMGNSESRKIYEKHAPCFYLRPSQKTPSSVVRENWIRAKYVRKDFCDLEDGKKVDLTGITQFRMPEGACTGYLMKMNVKKRVAEAMVHSTPTPLILLQGLVRLLPQR